MRLVILLGPSNNSREQVACVGPASGIAVCGGQSNTGNVCRRRGATVRFRETPLVPGFFARLSIRTGRGHLVVRAGAVPVFHLAVAADGEGLRFVTRGCPMQFVFRGRSLPGVVLAVVGILGGLLSLLSASATAFARAPRGAGERFRIPASQTDQRTDPAWLERPRFEAVRFRHRWGMVPATVLGCPGACPVGGRIAGFHHQP